MIQTNKVYVVIGDYEVKNENDETIETRHNVVIKAFEQNTAEPIRGVWYKKGANFDETKDFENAIILNAHFEDIEIGTTKVENGEIVKGE